MRGRVLLKASGLQSKETPNVLYGVRSLSSSISLPRRHHGMATVSMEKHTEQGNWSRGSEKVLVERNISLSVSLGMANRDEVPVPMAMEVNTSVNLRMACSTAELFN